MKPKPEYVSSSEGAKLLRMDRQRFFYYVETRNIRILPGETKRKNRYNYEDIVAVKKELGIGEGVPTIVDWVGPADVTSTVALDFLVYQEAIIADINHYVSWVRKNPHISLAAFDANDRKTVLAYVALLPLPEATILEVLRGKRTEMGIQPEEIESYERPGGYTLLVESAVSHPDHPEKLGAVLKGLTDYWCEQYPQRYIDKIYAQSVSNKGDILIQKLYFAARYDIAETAHMLDLKRPGASRLIRRFQECLKSRSEDQQ
ncbi:MAG TPA: hypothetical protein VEL31_15950 [Ktedonobacteraceae bacterium]|nr:hypothetical protein [Ktedonobacteraceae bacterium]